MHVVWSGNSRSEPACTKWSRIFNRFDKQEELNRVFDEAWKTVASDDYEAGRLAEAEGRGPEDSKPRKPLRVRFAPCAMAVFGDIFSICGVLPCRLWQRTARNYDLSLLWFG